MPNLQKDKQSDTWICRDFYMAFWSFVLSCVTLNGPIYYDHAVFIGKIGNNWNKGKIEEIGYVGNPIFQEIIEY